jgi:hypothetical protein
VKKRFKWPLKPLFQVGTANGAVQGLKNKNRHGFAVLVAILVTTLTLILPVHAEDHKTRTITFISSGMKTSATSQTSTFDVSAYKEGQIFVDVTALDGSSTLNISVQTSPDNVKWYKYTDYVMINQITTTGQYRQIINNFGNYMRINYTVGGTSVTFSVTGVFKN